MTATQGNSVALACLNQAIDCCGQDRKAIAFDLHITEQTLSKITSGAQAFGIDKIEELPDAIVADFLQRWGRERGFRVVMLSTEELYASMIERLQATVNELVASQRLYAVRTRTAKASLTDNADIQRRSA